MFVLQNNVYLLWVQTHFTLESTLLRNTQRDIWDILHLLQVIRAEQYWYNYYKIYVLKHKPYKIVHRLNIFPLPKLVCKTSKYLNTVLQFHDKFWKAACLRKFCLTLVYINENIMTESCRFLPRLFFDWDIYLNLTT